MTAAVLALQLLLAGTAEEERAKVHEKLEAEKAAAEALKKQDADVLALLDAMERISRQSAARVEALQRQLKALDAQARHLEALEDETQDGVREQLRAIGPRLLLLYRAGRQDRLGFLLSASDFATMMRRSRSLNSLVREDVTALEETRRLVRFAQSLSRRAQRMRSAADEATRVLVAEAALAKGRRAAFEDALALVRADANQKGRLIKDLEHAEYELQQLVAELNASATSGFRAMRGHLPYPTKGMIEVGYGNVFNPRFNTVTLQKGLDFRARAGTPVVAIAEGTVAYAGWLKGYGNLVIIDHGGGYHSLMAHLASLDVEPGNKVEAGEIVGAVGDTGSLKGDYLYFEIRQRGDAVDPAPWLDEEASLPQ